MWIAAREQEAQRLTSAGISTSTLTTVLRRARECSNRMYYIFNINDIFYIAPDGQTSNHIKLKTRLNGKHIWKWKINPAEKFLKVFCRYYID